MEDVKQHEYALLNEIAQRAILYARYSFRAYSDLRNKAKVLVSELKQRGIEEVYRNGNDEVIDIRRLTCIENRIKLRDKPGALIITTNRQNYHPVHSAE